MKQVPTGIEGLDTVLNGGFLRPSTVLIAGTAGTGKTTFVMQSIFNAAKNDEVCMYVTALSEPIAMINNFMSNFSFFNISLLGKGNVKYVPIDIEILHKGGKSVIEEVERHIELIKPDRIVIDPINVFTSGQDKKFERQFYYEFFTRVKGWNSLVMLTGEFTKDALVNSTVGYLVDGIIQINNEPDYEKNMRFLSLLKMRGLDFHSGKQACKISKDGFVVFPRLPVDVRSSVSNERIHTGIKGLDEMTGNGFLGGSSILLSGSSGTGKTVFGMQFIMDGLLKNEPAMIVSFEEDAAHLRKNSRSFGWELLEFEDKGMLKILSPSDFDVLELAVRIEEFTEKLHARRILFDGTGRLQRLLPKYTQLPEYMRGIINYLKSRNITTLYTSETLNLTGITHITGTGVSPLMDTVILLRYVEINSEVRKAISVLKMRGSDHDKEIYGLIITGKGVEIKKPFSEYSGILSGSPVKKPSELTLL